MTTYKFIAGEPEDGQLVTGIVYHFGRRFEIAKALVDSGLIVEPIGYVAKVETEEFVIGEPEMDLPSYEDIMAEGEPEGED